MKRETGTCVHCDMPARTVLDGDKLCQQHADAWVRGEWQAEREREHTAMVEKCGDAIGGFNQKPHYT